MNPFQQFYGLTGGSGSSSITASANCSWNASSSAPWITITSGGSGPGPGTMNYSVAPNTGAARSGGIIIQNQTLVITQSGTSRGYGLANPNSSFTQSRGAGNLGVTTTASCAWIPTTNVNWITITSGGGAASRNITFSVPPNTPPPSPS